MARSHGLKGRGLAGLLVGLALGGVARAQSLSGPSLVEGLRYGGYVLLMRHARSPLTPPDAAHADAGNPGLERQLDGTGRATARAMGQAIRSLRIPVGEVWSSPTYRALETVRLAGLPAAKSVDRGLSMQAAAGRQAAWLRSKVSERPRAGTDVIIVTHSPNITAAFGRQAAGLSDGEALVFRPAAAGAATLVGRIRIEAWPSLAARR
jgi:phosphohistidine phosphatase SixA